MALSFPNPTRSFDPTVNCVRFSGHDSTIEVSFFMEVNALVKIDLELTELEPEILASFDVHREQIEKAAIRAYTKGKYVCILSPDSF